MIGIEVVHITVRVEQQRIVLIQRFIAIVLMVTDGRCILDVVDSLWFCHKRTAQHGNSHDDKHDSGNDFTAKNTVNGILAIQGNNVRNVSVLLTPFQQVARGWGLITAES
jgi:hypothetical protein